MESTNNTSIEPVDQKNVNFPLAIISVSNFVENGMKHTICFFSGPGAIATWGGDSRLSPLSPPKSRR